ncbi:MAG: hypothetical protein ACREOO_30365 [bacterium]
MVLALFHTIFWVDSVQPQGLYEPELTKAEQAYNEGFFDQVLALVNACLDKGDLTTAERAWAYKLLGQANISKNELQLARSYVQKLLEVAPDYAPDRDQDLHAWIELVEEAKMERERQLQPQQPAPADEEALARAAPTGKGRGKMWLWFGGGGTLVTAGVIYALVSQKDQKESNGFPDPVGRP